jgi:hypothetical protein
MCRCPLRFGSNCFQDALRLSAVIPMSTQEARVSRHGPALAGSPSICAAAFSVGRVSVRSSGKEPFCLLGFSPFAQNQEGAR